MTKGEVTNDVVVSNLARAITLLRECNNAEEAKNFVDIGHAAKVYAERQRLGVEAQNSAVVFVLRAKRRLGEILTNVQLHRGGRPNEKPVDPERQVSRLKDIGISRDLSSKAQKIASIPERQFEHTLAYQSRRNVSVNQLEKRMLGIAERSGDRKPEQSGPKIDYSCPACGHGWRGRPKAAGNDKEGDVWAIGRICNVIDVEIERTADEQRRRKVISALRDKVFELVGVKRWQCAWKGCINTWEGVPTDQPQDWSWPDAPEVSALVNSGLAAEHTFNSFAVLCPEHASDFASILYGADGGSG